MTQEQRDTLVFAMDMASENTDSCMLIGFTGNDGGVYVSVSDEDE